MVSMNAHQVRYGSIAAEIRCHELRPLSGGKRTKPSEKRTSGDQPSSCLFCFAQGADQLGYRPGNFLFVRRFPNSQTTFVDQARNTLIVHFDGDYIPAELLSLTEALLPKGGGGWATVTHKGRQPLTGGGHI